MNGRLYDPKLHRFLQPDNYVQDPYNSQNFNRYGYVLNNPLSHVDPSGEIAFVPLLLLIGKAALVGAGISGVGYTASVAFSPGGFNNWNWGQFGKSLAIGAVSGVVTAGIGAVFGHATGTFINEVGRGLAHGLVNGGISDLTGGDFMTGFLSGGLGSLAGSGFQAWGGDFAKSFTGTVGFSAASGGIGAELSGGDFWRGAATGATVATLNHMGGKILSDGKKKVQNNELLSEDGKKIVGGAGVAISSTEGVAKSLAWGELDPAGGRALKGFLKVAGRITGGAGLANDGYTIYKKGIFNATKADYLKLGVSAATVFAKSNPYTISFSIAYGVADMAGYNPLNYIP